MQLLATDLEVGLRSRCEASVAKGGSLTLPAKKLYEIIKALPDTDVRIERTRRREGGGRSVRLADADAAARGFSDVAGADGRRQRDAAARRTKQMVGKTQFAITGEDTRYFLNGALFVLKAEQMTFVATDGHRLALVSVPRDAGKAQEDGRRSARDPAAQDARRARPPACGRRGTFSTSAARTICSSTSAAGCSSRG